MKNFSAKEGDPTGVPSNRKPSVSSIPMDDVLLEGFVEYVSMQYFMSVAKVGFCSRRDGMMLWLLQDVRILDLCGLMLHPRSFPSDVISSRKNRMSGRGIIADRSSTHANKCEMLPYPSSPGSPARSLLCARVLSFASNGCKTLFITREANVEERGQP